MATRRVRHDSPELQLEDAVCCTTTLLDLAAHTGLDRQIAATLPTMWRNGLQYLRSGNEAERIFGYSLLLSAIRSTPGGAQALLAALHHILLGASEPCDLQ